MASVRKSDLEKTKILQCEWTVEDWENQSRKVGSTLLMMNSNVNVWNHTYIWRANATYY